MHDGMMAITDHSPRVPYGEWYVLRVVAGCEDRVVRRIQEERVVWIKADQRWAELSGCEAWSPQCTVRRIVSTRTERKVERTEGPLFRGYVLLRLDEMADIAAIEAMREAIEILRYRGDGRLWPLRAKDVLSLRDREGRKGGIVIDENGALVSEWADLPKGAAVKVIGGSFEGQEGEFVEQVSDGIKILLDMLGASRETTIPEAQLIPVE